MIGRAKVSIYCHATEDRDKIIEVFNNFTPKRNLNEEEVMGHFGNRISIFRADIKKDASSLLQGLLRKLSEEDFQEVVNSLHDRIDGDRRFHLRLDKQEAFFGKIALNRGPDGIDCAFKLIVYTKGKTLECLKGWICETGIRDRSALST